ncbi:MAG: DNA recombination protein RmuC [Ruminococcaceae bacterium]|nr:DNA recombination protein RmuC [Oscillospiraceae bacterium]
MDILILVVSLLSLTVAAICLLMLMRMRSGIQEADNTDGYDKKLDELREAIYNEFARNRSEQNQSALAQRQEMTNKISEVNRSLDALNKTNQEQLIRIFRQMAEGMTAMRDKNSEIIEKQNQKIESALTKIQESNEKKLEEMRTVVDEKLTSTLTQRLDSSFKTVSSQLENLYKALGEMKEMSGGITENVTTLNRVLTNVKARGTWAEVQLKNILDQTIPGMYVENYAPKSTSKDRVEFAIKIPSGENYSEITYLPLDSKFPMEDYVRLCNAADRADPEGLAEARRALEDRVIHEARDIKKYINVPSTTPFAVMYLASEGLYAEISASPNAVAERIQNDYNVMICGPSTVTALLNSLAMGFRIAAINEKAHEVRKILSAVKAQYDTFETVLAKAKKKIDEAGRSLDDAQHRNNMIQKKLRSVEALDSAESNDILQLDAAPSLLVDEEEDV